MGNREGHVTFDTTMASYRAPVFANKKFFVPSVSEQVDVAKEKLNEAKVDVKQAAGAAPQGADLYARFAFAGALGCAVTHGALTPVDVVKTRIQLEPEVYNKGFIGGFRQVIQKEGAGALLTGLGPTAAGYFLEGAFKFGGYEYWKKFFIDQYGVAKASENRQVIYLTSAAIAEFFADIALCPLEATRIRLVSQPEFAGGLVSGFSKILSQEGIGAFYGGFIPMLFKQIPYTCAKFAVFEVIAEQVVASMGKTKDQLSPGTLTTVNLGSGLFSGFAAALISQPADTLLSKVNKTKAAPGQGMISRMGGIVNQIGISGLFAGTGARLVMIGTLTAGQFGIYGDIKRLLGATSGVEIAKVAK